MMDGPILLAVALQHWDQFSRHALVTRDVAKSLAKDTRRAPHVLSVYEYDQSTISGVSAEMEVQRMEGLRQRTDNLMRQRMNDYVAPLKADGLEIETHFRVGNPCVLIVNRVDGDGGYARDREPQ